MRFKPILAAALVTASLLPTAAAFADGRSGGGRIGDGYIDDLQKNPRLIEPGQSNNPVRYRVGAPNEGWYDRQVARDGHYFNPDYAPAGRYGRW